MELLALSWVQNVDDESPYLPSMRVQTEGLKTITKRPCLDVWNVLSIVEVMSSGMVHNAVLSNCTFLSTHTCTCQLLN